MPHARILSLSTAVPVYKLKQSDIAHAAARVFASKIPDFSRFMPVYENAAIETRYSSAPLEWYENPVNFAERNALYIETALNLLEKTAREAISKARLELDDIDGLVVVSSSGIATPSLDALLMERMQLKRNMERLPLFGLGCAGGVMGLARTAQLAQGAPDKHYLYMVVELCGLNFLHDDLSKSNIIATALFADGAAAAVVSCQGKGAEIHGWQEYTWPDSLNVMGWDVTNNGLRAIFSQDIPAIVRRDMARIVDGFLKAQHMKLEDFHQILSHPGGAKVLDAIEESLHRPAGSLTHSRSILRQYGNMSAATVMFVLGAALEEKQAGQYLLTAFGPGFTAALMRLSIV